ncbi:hypothetical protein Tco_1033342 [Tanacetum coccineum]|uniref:Uncharacterized protein n=1 Tax=Tanacetum coccineum TaxID=301880 RepID=A0ABQ5GEE8_9ASTR
MGMSRKSSSFINIQFSNIKELQENQEEHICYYYWENCFSILNVKEAGNTKSPLSADTFGNSRVDVSETLGPETPAKEVVDNANSFALIFLVGYDTGSEVVTGLTEEFQEGDMVDALSRVLEQKSLENGLIAVAEDGTTHFLELHYSPSSILVRSRPITLGEAFSFARIVEARFEDERSTIAIAKPNKLTAHVHIQDLEQTTRGKGDEPNRILLVTIHHMIYPITVEFLNQIFSPHGGVDESETSGPETPAKEVVDNANGSALIFLVGYDTGSEVVTGLSEEFQEGDMVDALSRVLEQKSLEKGVDIGSGRRDCTLFGASLFAFLNPGSGYFARRRIWDPRINISSRQHLEGKVVVKE